MPVYMFHGRPSSQMAQWKQGSGWSLFTARADSDYTHSIDGVALEDLWVGTANQSGAGPTYVCHWDGLAWTSYSFAAGQYKRAVISTAGDNAVFLGMGMHLGSERGSFWRFTGSGFSFLWQGPSTFQAQDVFPLAISADLCYWVYSGTAANPLWRWTTGAGNERIPGGSGLPAAQAGGICLLGSELFILFATAPASGAVYRGTWAGGFVLDNTTDGPFLPMPGSANVQWPMIAASADGLSVCVYYGANFWVRNGADDWTNVGPTGVGGTSYQPAMASGQILLAPAANLSRWSDDGGTSWQNSSYANAQIGGAFSLITPAPYNKSESNTLEVLRAVVETIGEEM